MANLKVASVPAERVHTPFTFAKITRSHQEHPEANRDYLLAHSESGLAVICDGVGDVVGAGQAARLAAKTIKTRWQHMLTQLAPGAIPDLAVASRHLLEEANQAVLALGERLAKNEKPSTEEGKKQHYAETTIALALLSPHQDGYTMAYAHVGDSRIYLLRPNEPLRRLTVDDGYFLWVMNKGELNEQDALRIDQASRAEELSEEEREHFNKRNGISQSLGGEHPTFHLGQIELYPNDRVLLSTDGIHDNLTDAEIEELLRKGARTTVARTLLQHTVERSQQDENLCIRAKKDDMSAIVITCHFSSENHA